MLTPPATRRYLYTYLLLLVAMAGLAARFSTYAMDGDAVCYMDIADLIHHHQWHAVVNAYWHPLYPALLCLVQMAFHTTRFNELGPYHFLTFILFLLQMASVFVLVRGIVRLREKLSGSTDYLLSEDGLRIACLAFLTIAAGREVAFNRILTDGLLLALMFFAFGMLQQMLTNEGRKAYFYAAAFGFLMGLAYLTKSFAFVLTFLCLAVWAVFAVWKMKRSLRSTISLALVSACTFGCIAGPYIAALSHQKGRFDFGDSGSLNYAWYVSGTRVWHLEPWMKDEFGSARVHLLHPPDALIKDPFVLSYSKLPYGTYPTWFDPSFWNERVQPIFNLKKQVVQFKYNLVMLARFVFNHPEFWLLLLALWVAGARWHRHRSFALPMMAISAGAICTYLLVTLDERYVMAPYIVLVIATLAMLSARPAEAETKHAALLLIMLMGLLPVGQQVRHTLEERRVRNVMNVSPMWKDPDMYGAAEALVAMGVKPGDHMACIGDMACLRDYYWVRLTGARINGEIYLPPGQRVMPALDAMRDRDKAFTALRNDGNKVVVGYFNVGEVDSQQHSGATGWKQLGNTHFYALRLQ